MKKIMLTFFTVTLLTTVGVAQSATRSADVKKQYELRLEQQKKELGATDEQVRKIVDINKHYHKELQAVNGDKTLTKEQRETKIKAVLQERGERIKEVLTPEQYEKYRNVAKREADKMKNKGEGEKKKG